MNPKDLVGAKKAPTRFVPQALVLEVAPVMASGAAKYGPFNWREQPVSAVTYAEAMQRHLSAWLEGQDDAEDSGLPHIAHIAASCGILLDAAANGSLLDDRVNGPAADILRRLDRSTTAPVPQEVEQPLQWNAVGPLTLTPDGSGGMRGMQFFEGTPFEQGEKQDQWRLLCEDTAQHFPGRHMLTCPDFNS